MDTRHFKFDELVHGPDHASKQLRVLYEAAVAIDSPTIVELGTSVGRSATCFLTACEKRGGRLVSVDVADCSSVSDSPLATFVRADAADVETAIRAAPFLRNGIDVLYVDALHIPERVRREVEAWFPLLKAGGLAFFDDVDPTPYRKGARKDNVWIEHSLEGIATYLHELFNANSDTLELSITYGSTGLARIRKLSEAPLRSPLSTPKRSWLVHARLAMQSLLASQA